MIHSIRPVNILLVEDNPGDIYLMKEAFKESTLSIQLNTVMDGEEALHYLQKSPPYNQSPTPDLILLDLNLPKIDGRTVLARVKANDTLKCIPIIVLSTSNAKKDIVDSYNLHVNCYITKPIDFDQFINIVRLIETFWINTAKLPTMV